MVPPVVPLQVCDPAVAGYDYLLDFEFIKAFTCTFANPAGLLVVGAIVYGGIGLSIYIETNDVIIPVVLMLVAGGAILSQIAGLFVSIATVVLLLTGAGAITYLYLSLSR